MLQSRYFAKYSIYWIENPERKKVRIMKNLFSTAIFACVAVTGMNFVFEITALRYGWSAAVGRSLLQYLAIVVFVGMLYRSTRAQSSSNE